MIASGDVEIITFRFYLFVFLAKLYGVIQSDVDTHIFILPVSPLHQAVMFFGSAKMDYLIAATNELSKNVRWSPAKGRIEDRILAPTPSSLTADLAVACAALSRLVEDNAFFEALKVREERRREVARSFSDFCNEFIRRDRALLEAAGMDQRAAGLLIRDPARLLELVNLELPDIQTIRNRLADFAGTVCEEAYAFKGKRERGRFSTAVFEVSGGAAVLTANTVATPILGFLAIASSAVGGGLFWDGLKRFGGKD